MEEDAGKLVHVGAPGIWGSKASAVDYNRSSVPLIEIVTEPDISSPAEAREFMVMLRAILVTLGICNGNMEEGNLRCDANISVRERGDAALGVKVEIKNMNSLKAIERALVYETERLMRMKSEGVPITQETRLWDDSSQKTALMRSKEESHDYRYFPDPDLLPLAITDEWIESVRGSLPAHAAGAKERVTRRNTPSPSPRRGSSWSTPATRTSSRRRWRATAIRATWRTGSSPSSSRTRTTSRGSTSRRRTSPCF